MAKVSIYSAEMVMINCLSSTCKMSGEVAVANSSWNMNPMESLQIYVEVGDGIYLTWGSSRLNWYEDCTGRNITTLRTNIYVVFGVFILFVVRQIHRHNVFTFTHKSYSGLKTFERYCMNCFKRGSTYK